jgi:lipid-binding SYLF domain-containing protein
MILSNRRSFAVGLLALSGMAACSNGVGTNNAARIDARVETTLDTMYNNYPGTKELATNASGILIMPVITKVGFGIGLGFGQGALQVGEAKVDYYSASSASAGPQIGVNQYSHVLFFMTPEALMEFRASRGWSAGANIEYAYKARGEALIANTATTGASVVAVVFGQAGLKIGATLDGTKYTRIIP